MDKVSIKDSSQSNCSSSGDHNSSGAVISGGISNSGTDTQAEFNSGTNHQLKETHRKTTVPCLVCGDCGKSINWVNVKVEANEYENDGADNEDLLIDDAQTSGGNRLPTRNQADNQCLETPTETSPSLNFPQSRSMQLFEWTEDEKCAYQWFVRWFRLPLMKKEKKGYKKFTNYGWDGGPGKDPFPFCGRCTIQLMELLEFQRNVEELERAIRKGIDELKVKANSCEGAFEKNGIYDRDVRYKRVRKLIVADFMERYPNQSISSEQNKEHAEMSRKSVRTKRSVTRFTPHENDPSCSEKLPVVLVSTSEKTNADEHLLEGWIKPETCHEPDDNYTRKRLPKSSHKPKLTHTESFPLLNMTDIDSIETRNDKNSHCDSNLIPTERSRRRRTVQTSALDLDDVLEDDIILHGDVTPNHASNDEDCDDPMSPSASPPPSKPRKRKEKANESKGSDLNSGTPSIPKRKKIRKEEDEDWQLNEGDKDLLGGSPDEDEDNDACDPDYDIDTGKRKNTKGKEDLEKGTITYKNLVFYLREPYDNNMVECSKCNTVIKKRGLRPHYLRKHTDTYACKQCNFRSARAGELKSHIATAHQGAPPIRKICEICGKPCTKQSIWLHMWSHKSTAEREEALARGGKGVPAAKVKKHQCDECGRPFSSKYGLRRHKERMHSSEEAKESRMELCPECGGTYLSLRCHRQVVHGVFGKRYTCLEEGCGKEFKTLHFLTQHKDGVHRKIRPYKCTLCPREFTKEKLLKNHMNLHMGIRPWPCEHCPMAFVTKGNMKRHIDVYHSEGSNPKRKAFARGPAMLAADVRKKTLISEGKYLPPSALATWAAGRAPTSHFIPGTVPDTPSLCSAEGNE